MVTASDTQPPVHDSAVTSIRRRDLRAAPTSSASLYKVARCSLLVSRPVLLRCTRFRAAFRTRVFFLIRMTRNDVQQRVTRNESPYHDPRDREEDQRVEGRDQVIEHDAESVLES